MFALDWCPAAQITKNDTSHTPLQREQHKTKDIHRRCKHLFIKIVKGRGGPVATGSGSLILDPLVKNLPDWETKWKIDHSMFVCSSLKRNVY